MHLHMLAQLLLLVLSPLVFGIPAGVNPICQKTTEDVSAGLQNLDTSSPAVCVTSRRWMNPQLVPKDCMATVVKFYTQKIAQHRVTNFEFVPYGTRPQSTMPVERTPQRYTYRACTMAIVNLGTLLPEDVPGMSSTRQYQRTDVGNYLQNWALVQKLLNQCMDRYCASDNGSSVNFITQTGWTSGGAFKSIGIFLWGTGSYMDQHIFGRSDLSLTDDSLVAPYSNGSLQR